MHERGRRAVAQRPERALLGDRFGGAADGAVAQAREPAGGLVGAARGMHGLAPLHLRVVDRPLPEPVFGRRLSFRLRILGRFGVELEASRANRHQIDDRGAQSIHSKGVCGPSAPAAPALIVGHRLAGQLPRADDQPGRGRDRIAEAALEHRAHLGEKRLEVGIVVLVLAGDGLVVGRKNRDRRAGSSRAARRTRRRAGCGSARDAAG